MVDQPAFAGGATARIDLAPEPFVVIHRVCEQIQRYLIDGTSGPFCHACELRFEFGRNLQVHETSVGCIDSAVNRQLTGVGHGGCAIGSEGV